jgi:hypothetical protein
MWNLLNWFCVVVTICVMCCSITMLVVITVWYPVEAVAILAYLSLPCILSRGIYVLFLRN